MDKRRDEWVWMGEWYVFVYKLMYGWIREEMNEWTVHWTTVLFAFINTLRSRQNGRHFADDTFKPIFLNENIPISIKIWLKFVPKVPINNIPALVQIMAWRREGDKPLSEPMMVCLLTHICVTRPQWVIPLSTGNAWMNNYFWCCWWCGTSAAPAMLTQYATWAPSQYNDGFSMYEDCHYKY